MGINIQPVKITIDGQEIVVNSGITILRAAQENGVRIPTLCHHPALSDRGGCRMCVVEVDGAPRLSASCVTPVRDGMQVVTVNERITETRRTLLEFLFAERNHNCMFCPRSGDCELQDLAYELQMDHLTVPQSFQEYPVDITSDYIGLDHNRCVLCGRCVRACEELSGCYVLNFQNRGPATLIGFDLNEKREGSGCYSCGACMQVCPTGAIMNRYRSHYAVKGHAKDWQTIESLCSQCGLLCPTISSVKDNNLLKIEGKIVNGNDRPDRGQLCYKSRFQTLKSMEKRLRHPMVRKEDGKWTEDSWESVFDLVVERMNSLRDRNGGKTIFGLASGAASNEELVIFRDLMVAGWTAGHIDTLDGSHFRTVSRTLKSFDKKYREASWKVIPDADFILLLGANPYRSQPAVSALIRRKILEKETELAVIGSTDSMYPLTTPYLPVTQEHESLLLHALLAEVAASFEQEDRPATWPEISAGVKKVNVSELLKKSGLDEAARKTFYDVVKKFISSENPLILAGEEITGLEESAALRDAVSLGLLKGLLPDDTLRLIILKLHGNSAGAWKLGIASGKETGSENGRTGGFVLLGGEDILDPGVTDGLIGLEFLAVFGPCLPDILADKAHVFIPKPLWMEEEGTFTSLDGYETAYKHSVVHAPDGIKNAWQIFQTLAERVGFNSQYKTWEELSKRAEHEIRNN